MEQVNERLVVPTGYERITVNSPGLVDGSTGEYTNGIHYLLPEGTTIITPRHKEMQRAYRQGEEEKRKARHAKENFFFVLRNTGFDTIQPAMAARLIYLSTYMSYDNNALMMGHRHMTKKDLPKVLGIAERTAALFWKAVSPGFISENDRGHLCMDSNLFLRGNLPKKKHETYLRVFNKGVKQLYKAANGKHLKQIGYLFLMLPYISVEFNVLCRNPYETDLDAVELLSISEFCESIGYDLNNMNRLKAIYNSIQFQVGNHEELFCKLIYDGVNERDAIICINPSILYCGSNKGKVEITKLYFKR